MVRGGGEKQGSSKKEVVVIPSMLLRDTACCCVLYACCLRALRCCCVLLACCLRDAHGCVLVRTHGSLCQKNPEGITTLSFCSLMFSPSLASPSDLLLSCTLSFIITHQKSYFVTSHG